MFQIETNIPLPTGTRGAPAKYPLADMHVGESFFVPCEGAECKVWRGRLNGTVARFCKANPDMKFAIRSVDGGLRVWRTK